MSYITGDMITENPKHGTVIICGVPKKQDGTFYCPYCSFESEEIEDFATSMCWDCALADDEEINEEENVEF